eukprot:COSAG02_NODE_42439_length_384_cov_1.203509_1_plen_58_part_00
MVYELACIDPISELCVRSHIEIDGSNIGRVALLVVVVVVVAAVLIASNASTSPGYDC